MCQTSAFLATMSRQGLLPVHICAWKHLGQVVDIPHGQGATSCTALKGRTVQVLHVDPVAYGAQVVAKVQRPGRLHTREHPLPACAAARAPTRVYNAWFCATQITAPTTAPSVTCTLSVHTGRVNGRKGDSVWGLRKVRRATVHLRGAAGSWGSFAFDGCVSVSGTVPAAVHSCRALQRPSVLRNAACWLPWSEEALAFSRAETAVLWA